MNVMCGRSGASQPSASASVSAPPTSAAAVALVDPLTHAFLSNRRPPPLPAHSSSFSSSLSFAAALPRMNHMPLSSVARASSSDGGGGYAVARPLPQPLQTAAQRASSTPTIPQSDYSQLRTRVNAIPSKSSSDGAVGDQRGSAHALLALMESKHGVAHKSARSISRAMKQEYTHSEDALNSATSSFSQHSGNGGGAVESPSTIKGKRLKREDETSDTDSVRTEQSAGSSNGNGNGKCKKELKRKFRKATHTVRKEEKEKLLHELQRLQFQMDELKRRALDGDSTQTKNQKSLTNAVLRDTLQQQLAQFADAQVLFSEYGTTQVISPISLPIRLGRDRTERLATLTAMKERKIELSQEFLKRRCGQLDLRKPYCEDQRFETPTGDYCALRFSIIQFEGVQSVKQVFDVLHFYFCNIEISISEKLGNITIREDDDMQDKSISQNRLVGTTSKNVLLESNTVMFSEYLEQAQEGEEGEYALISAEFVDEDELYPYRPDQRARKDINAILQLTSYTHMVRNAYNEDVEELVVVFTRWSHSRLHYPNFPVSKAALHDMRENMERWGESMHRTLRESLYPDAT